MGRLEDWKSSGDEEEIELCTMLPPHSSAPTSFHHNCSDMHLRQSFSSGCVQKKKKNSTGKPLATQTMLISAHPKVSDMTDNAQLVTAKTFRHLFFSRRGYLKNKTKQTTTWPKRLGARACSCWLSLARHALVLGGRCGGPRQALGHEGPHAATA